MDHFSNRTKPEGNDSATAERRATDRRALSAEAEVLDMTTGARLTVRLADVSPEGCYLDTFNPSAVGTPVRVTIRRNDAEFTAPGTVRNAQKGMGMGIAFGDLGVARRALLEGWIEELENPYLCALAASGAGPGKGGGWGLGSSDGLAERLIGLLHEKGILSDSDVALLLHKEIL